MMGKPVTISDKDLILISTYLDGKLTPEETARLEARRVSDVAFSELVVGMGYARKMLRTLPHKRAPRNFTLSPDRYAKPVRRAWLQPALSFVSVAAAVTLVVVYAGGLFLSNQRTTSPVALAPAAAMQESASDLAVEPTIAPLINWNPVLGYGGGGDNMAYGKGGGPGGAGGPGFVVEEAMPQSAPVVTEEPPAMLTEPESGGAPMSEDPSTMILGIPAEETRGRMVDMDGRSTRRSTAPLSARNLVMVLSGALALLAGMGALFLRRR